MKVRSHEDRLSVIPFCPPISGSLQAEIMMSITSEFGFTHASGSMISVPRQSDLQLFDLPEFLN
jgi:hypothetical protein